MMTTIAALLLTATPGPAESEKPPVTGADISQLCMTSEGPAELACRAYLNGVIEGLALGQLEASGGAMSFCPPVALTSEDARVLFLGFVAAEPDREAQDASRVLLEALETAFPCAEELQEEAAPVIAAAAYDHSTL